MDTLRPGGQRDVVSGASMAEQADRYARMMEEAVFDIDELDFENFPPDRRFLLGDKEAWVYEHGNICELVFVRVGQGD